MLTVAEKIRLTLESLGTSSEEVAATLAGRGISGQRDTGGSCPLARLIQQDIPETAGYFVAAGYWVQETYVETPGEDVDLPPGAVQFVADFDAGLYPHLDEEVDE